MKQVEVADLLGIRQPDVSKMLLGEFRQFAVERLLRFLVALNQDVEIESSPIATEPRLGRCVSPERLIGLVRGAIQRRPHHPG